MTSQFPPFRFPSKEGVESHSVVRNCVGHGSLEKHNRQAVHMERKNSWQGITDSRDYGGWGVLRSAVGKLERQRARGGHSGWGWPSEKQEGSADSQTAPYVQEEKATAPISRLQAERARGLTSEACLGRSRQQISAPACQNLKNLYRGLPWVSRDTVHLSLQAASLQTAPAVGTVGEHIFQGQGEGTSHRGPAHRSARGHILSMTSSNKRMVWVPVWTRAGTRPQKNRCFSIWRQKTKKKNLCPSSRQPGKMVAGAQGCESAWFQGSQTYQIQPLTTDKI